MSKNIEISVIIAVYNVEDYIKRCLESIVNQTYNNMQIIIVDDGSTDKSSEICDEYALIDQRIEVIHKENGGLSSARNAGIERAKGDYLIFVDSDDYVDTGLCKRLCRALEKYGEIDAICFDGMEENKDQKKGIRRIPLKTESHCHIDTREHNRRFPGRRSFPCGC